VSRIDSSETCEIQERSVLAVEYAGPKFDSESGLFSSLLDSLGHGVQLGGYRTAIPPVFFSYSGASVASSGLLVKAFAS
jgi:hypothetical protein